MTAARSLTTIGELSAAGLVPEEKQAGMAAVAARYAVAVTPALVSLIDGGDPAGG